MLMSEVEQKKNKTPAAPASLKDEKTSSTSYAEIRFTQFPPRFSTKSAPHQNLPKKSSGFFFHNSRPESTPQFNHRNAVPALPSLPIALSSRFTPRKIKHGVAPVISRNVDVNSENIPQKGLFPTFPNFPVRRSSNMNSDKDKTQN